MYFAKFNTSYTYMIVFCFKKPIERDNVPTAPLFGNGPILYLMEQVHAMKPKLAELESKTKEMEIDLAVQKKQIETLQNREFTTEFQVESDCMYLFCI